MTRRLRGLVDACHPLPSLAVTLLVVLLSAAAGRDASGIALMGCATLVGQLSVGWCNDAYDAGRDRRARRLEKPTVRGDVGATTLWWCAASALVLTVPLSLAAAGPRGATAHVVAVLSAWAYDLLLKPTALSWLPYAVSFGLLPAFVSLGLEPPIAPPGWLVVAAAVLGVAAHLANALPDLESDAEVGAGGVVARLGRRRATLLCLLCLVVATAVLSANVGLPILVELAVVGLVVAGAAAVGGAGRGLFRYVVLVALLAVVLLLVSTRTALG
ncbi:MAG TPA: UbiA family prenyltransferase [Candidatus Nanopelagicales bacterium]|nr:UbiA family prenyltransferase [Candidatus Nanopelagicales bacterium]